MKKRNEIIIIVLSTILTIALIWFIRGLIISNPTYSVYENTCNNKIDFVPENCLVLLDEKVNTKWIQDNCKIIYEESKSKLYQCSNDKYILKIE